MEILAPAALDFGGSNAYSGVSTSRTLMLKELRLLFAGAEPDTTALEYRSAIIDENVLLKPSASTRAKTFSYLRDRFALDPSVPVFRLLRFLWDLDVPGQPLMALLVAAFRDPVLRTTMPAVIDAPLDSTVTSPEFARIIESVFPNKLSEKTLESTGQNTTSTYRQSGHLLCLKGRTCVRQRVEPTPGSAAIALLFASLAGGGGRALLDSSWVRLLDSSPDLLLSEARTAANRGWLEYRAAGDVLEITFHSLFRQLGVDL